MVYIDWSSNMKKVEPCDSPDVMKDGLAIHPNNKMLSLKTMAAGTFLLEVGRMRKKWRRPAVQARDRELLRRNFHLQTRLKHQHQQ